MQNRKEKNHTLHFFPFQWPLLNAANLKSDHHFKAKFPQQLGQYWKARKHLLVGRLNSNASLQPLTNPSSTNEHRHYIEHALELREYQYKRHQDFYSSRNGAFVIKIDWDPLLIGAWVTRGAARRGFALPLDLSLLQRYPCRDVRDKSLVDRFFIPSTDVSIEPFEQMPSCLNSGASQDIKLDLWIHRGSQIADLMAWMVRFHFKFNFLFCMTYRPIQLCYQLVTYTQKLY